MKCPFCNSLKTNVLESRAVDGGTSIRRRRLCESCNKRFTTYEAIKGPALWVIKKDGRREPFDREKLRKGLLRATQKRPIAIDCVSKIVAEVEQEMMSAEMAEVPSTSIGTAVMDRLKEIDKVAWLRFASVYFEFGELRDFEKAITKTTKYNGKK